MNLKRLFPFVTLAAVLGIAFFFRFYLNNSGIPSFAFLRHDEEHYMTQVIAFLNGDWDIHYFINPSLYMYILYVSTLVAGWIQVVSGLFQSFDSFSLHVSFEPYLILILGRVLSLGVSTLSVGLVYYIAHRIFSPPVALVASLALAFNLTHIQRAVLAGNESTMVFMVLVYFVFLLGYFRSPSALKLAGCGLILGLASSVKYNALVQVIPLFAVSLLLALEEIKADPENRKKPFFHALIRILLLPKYNVGYLFLLVGFFIGSPYVLLNFSEFFHGFFRQYSFLHGGYTEFERAAQTRGFLYYPMNFSALNNGVVFGLFCAFGLIAALVRSVFRRDSTCILLVSAALPLYLFLGGGIFCRMRFLLPALPFLIILGAWALVSSFDLAMGWVFNKVRQGTVSQFLSRHGIYAVLSSLVLVPGALATYRSMEGQYGRIDPKQEVVKWIKANISPEEEIVEFANPRYNEFPHSKGMLKRYGYKEDWFKTGKRREAFQRFKESLYAFTPLSFLLSRSPSMKELKANIEEGGFNRLLVVMPTSQLIHIQRLPETAANTIHRCPYWDEFLHYIADLVLCERYSTQGKRFSLLLYDLP